jgi:hypothetical protein
MKKLLAVLSVSALVLSAVSTARADDKADKKAEKADAKSEKADAKAASTTITGEAQCAKCSLKKADQCTDVVVAKEGGKEVIYYLAKNDVTKGFHGKDQGDGKKVCTAKIPVKVTGTVKHVDGKHEIAASKIEVVKHEAH